MFERIGAWFRRNPETIPLGIGVACLAAAVLMLVNPLRLLVNGKGADGMVTDVVTRNVRDSDGKERVQFTATIRFRAGNRDAAIQRSWTQDRDGISRCFAGCYSKGERLKMLYLADDPDVAEVGSFWGLFGASLVLGLVGAMAMFFWRLWRSERAANASQG